MTPSGSWPSCASGSRSSGWSCIADKTRLIEFGRYAAQRREARGLRKPETFDFLGLHAHLREDRERALQATSGSRARSGCGPSCAVKTELMRRRHLPDPRTRSVARAAWCSGHYAYYAVPDNSQAMTAIPQQVIRHWRRALTSPQPTRTRELETDAPPRRPMAPHPADPAPLARRALRRQNPRQEPSALTRTLGSVRGAATNGGPYRNTGGRRC